MIFLETLKVSHIGIRDYVVLWVIPVGSFFQLPCCQTPKSKGVQVRFFLYKEHSQTNHLQDLEVVLITCSYLWHWLENCLEPWISTKLLFY